MRILQLSILALLSISGYSQRVGINTTSPLEPLDVNGNANFRGLIKINGNAGTNGQVITSTGPGTDPAWMSTAYTGLGRFWLTIANNSRSTGSEQGRAGWILSAGTSQSDSLDFASSNETGTEFTISNTGQENNFITVNKTGLYHFEGVIRYFVTSDLDINMFCRATLNFLANQPSLPDLNFILEEARMEKTGGIETSNGTNTYNLTVKFNLNVHLQTGTTCTFLTGFNLLRLSVANPLIAIGVSQGGYVAGQFVAE